MSRKNDISFEFEYGLNRREFLNDCAACAAGLTAMSFIGETLAAEQSLPMKGFEKAKIRLVFSHTTPDVATWPCIGYDYEGRKKELTAKLCKACPQIDFLPATALNAEEAKKILEGDKDVDGYLVYLLGAWPAVPLAIAASGKLTIFVDDLYGGSGEFLLSYAEARRKKMKVTGVASSRFEDVVEAARCFDCIKKLRSSSMLVVGRTLNKNIEEAFGTKVIDIPFPQIKEIYSQVDRKEAVKWAQRWIKNAKKVVEPSREEIEKAGAMYLTLLELLRRNNAQAITIRCLSGFREGNLPAYPCLGFFQLDNDGLVGGCEGDQRSTITKLLMTYLVGRPGFISDPVIDTAKNQIIYAHCVAPNKVCGPNGTANPYIIRNHSEDRKGASIQSLLPLNQMTTTIQIDPEKKQILMHQGNAVENVDEDRACRTKLAVEVKGDINKLFNYWDQWSWHRVTYYGDLKTPIRHIAALYGFEVVEEA